MQTAILTRPADRNEVLAQRLRDAAWQVCILPALTIEPLPPRAGYLPLPREFDLVVFVSGNAVRFYREQVLRTAISSAWPATTLAAAVGMGTAQALRNAGWLDAHATILHPDAHSPRHDSEALWELLQRQAVRPRKVLLVRGTTGRDWLADKLVEQGAEVVRHAVYRRSPACWAPQQLDQLQAWATQGLQPVWLLTSGEGMQAIETALNAAGLAQWWAGGYFVVTHPSLVGQLPVQATRATSTSRVKICLPNDDAIFNAFLTD
jgi:uroporphyrinogen-III synthase